MSGPRERVDRLVELELGRIRGDVVREMVKVISSQNFLRDAMTRYRIGQAEYKHKYEWLAWPEVIFRGEIYTEVLDAAIYQAMEAVTRSLLERGAGE